MSAIVGIRREDKNQWERRAPLTPADVADLTRDSEIRFLVQKSPIRVFRDEEYRQAGATLTEDLSPCAIVLAVKEIPLELLQGGKTYVFFSHTIKGQKNNLPMLARILSLGSQLVDYEKITDDQGQRLIAFGRHAGLAGMIDTLWALGKRLEAEGHKTPLASLSPAHRYLSLEEAFRTIARVGQDLRRPEALPRELRPLVVGFTGYGRASRGAQEILETLAPAEIAPAQLLRRPPISGENPAAILKVVFKEADTVESTGKGAFSLAEYRAHPEQYRSVFSRYLPHLHVLMNCVYWESRFPRLVTNDYLRHLYADSPPRLRVIGDISCDLEGAVQATSRITTPDHPVFVYEPASGKTRDGVEGRGPVILAGDNLPCELPREASQEFSARLKELVPALARANLTLPLEKSGLPVCLQRAMIAYQGRLTPSFSYLEKKLLTLPPSSPTPPAEKSRKRRKP